MITKRTHTNHFHIGRKIALAEVRDFQEAGLWTKELRTRLIRSAIVQKKHIERNYPEIHEVITYYAGRIAALKSQVTAQFSEQEEGLGREIAHLFSLSSCVTQEHIREATVYTAASGWAWERDEEDEQDLIERSRMLTLSPSDIQFGFNFTVTWLCICTIWFMFIPVVSFSTVLCVLLSSASFAFEIEGPSD